MVGFLSQSDISKKRKLHGWGEVYLVMKLVVCLFNIDIFEVDALTIKNFMSGIYIIIKKLLIRCLHYQPHYYPNLEDK